MQLPLSLTVMSLTDTLCSGSTMMAELSGTPKGMLRSAIGVEVL